jgi:hypothetical protein
MRLISLTPASAASVRALLTPVAMSTSIAGNQVSMVCHSRQGFVHLRGGHVAAQDYLLAITDSNN